MPTAVHAANMTTRLTSCQGSGSIASAAKAATPASASSCHTLLAGVRRGSASPHVTEPTASNSMPSRKATNDAASGEPVNRDVTRAITPKATSRPAPAMPRPTAAASSAGSANAGPLRGSRLVARPPAARADHQLLRGLHPRPPESSQRLVSRSRCPPAGQGELPPRTRTARPSIASPAGASDKGGSTTPSTSAPNRSCRTPGSSS